MSKRSDGKGITARRERFLGGRNAVHAVWACLGTMAVVLGLYTVATDAFFAAAAAVDTGVVRHAWEVGGFELARWEYAAELGPGTATAFEYGLDGRLLFGAPVLVTLAVGLAGLLRRRPPAPADVTLPVLG